MISQKWRELAPAMCTMTFIDMIGVYSPPNDIAANVAFHDIDPNFQGTKLNVNISEMVRASAKNAYYRFKTFLFFTIEYFLPSFGR